MSRNDDDTSRRRMLKSIGATGLALGAGGVVAAGGAAEETDASPDRAETSATDEEVSPDGYWEYKCEDFACCSGSGCQEYRRYCADGSCSGWEKSGCCAGDCGPISCT